MARTVRDATLQSRNARRSLKIKRNPYWRALDQGLHLGYRKRDDGGSWIVRRMAETGKYSENKIGATDDFQDADGVMTLSYFQAMEAARVWAVKSVRMEQDTGEVQDLDYSVSDAIRDYITYYSKEGKGISVVHNIVNAHILPKLGRIKIGVLTTKKISDWHQEISRIPPRLRTAKGAEQNMQDLSNDPETIRRRRATANRNLTVLRAALNYVWREGKVPSDAAWRRVKPFRNVEAPVIRYLSEAECVRLVNASEPDLRLIVQAALFTGCRYGEIVKLIVADYRADTGTIYVRLTKSGKPRHVFLTGEGKQFFDQVMAGQGGSDHMFTMENGEPWGKSLQSRRIKEACQRAKIEPAITYHVLRHTHGSLLAMKGVPLPVIAKQLGHADTRITERHYAHISPSYVAETIRQNFLTLGIVQTNNVTSLGG